MNGVKFLLIIFQRAVRIPKIGFDRGVTGRRFTISRRNGRLDERVDPPEVTPSERFQCRSY
jgi:hypothetical protein